MNEEFGVLKGMIPACTGVEMHKLAILQVRIPSNPKEQQELIPISIIFLLQIWKTLTIMYSGKHRVSKIS